MKVGGSNGSILSAPLLSTGWGNPDAKSHGAPHVGSRKDDAAHQVAGARQQAPHLALGEGSKGRIVCIQLPFTTIVEYCSEIHIYIIIYTYMFVVGIIIAIIVVMFVGDVQLSFSRALASNYMCELHISSYSF
jgi:hypothetical protein